MSCLPGPKRGEVTARSLTGGSHDGRAMEGWEDDGGEFLDRDRRGSVSKMQPLERDEIVDEQVCRGTRSKMSSLLLARMRRWSLRFGVDGWQGRNEI